MSESPHQTRGHQAHSSLLVLLIVVLLSLFGLLGVYASERTMSSQQRGVGKALEIAASRKTLLWKGARQIPWLLHRMELNGSGVPVDAASGPTIRHFSCCPQVACCMNWHGALHASTGLLVV